MQNIFRCTNCGANNRVGDQSCKNCGMQFQYSCPNCGMPVKGGDPACRQCGNTLQWAPSTAGSQARAKPAAKPAADKTENKSDKKSGASWALPLLGMLFVLCIAAAGVYVWLKLNEKPAPPLTFDNKAQAVPQQQPQYITSDTQAPQISNITVRNLTDNSVEISWITDEESTTQVIWHTKDGSTNMSKLKEALLTQHSEVLVGLKNNSTYYYQVKSADKFNNESTSEERTFPIGKEPGTARIVVLMNTMTIEEQPSGTRTLIRGQVTNTGDLPVKTRDVQVLANINMPGRGGTGEIAASLDPAPEVINPGDAHKFVVVVPNGTSPVYTITVKINNQ
jgi:hypothetical protein